MASFKKPDTTARSKKKLTAAKFKLLARAYTDNDLGAGSVYRVLIYAVEKADATGRFWKKNSTIAREIGIDRATVIRALNKLTLGGYIERRGRHNGVGNSCNVYNLALDLGGAIKAAKREQRRKEKFVHEQEANTTEKPPRWGRNPATPEVAAPPPQESQPCNTYTPSGRDPPSSKFGLNHPQISHVRKRIPFGISAAGPAAIRSAFMIEADQPRFLTCL